MENVYIFKNPKFNINFNFLREQNILCDLTVKVDDKEIRVHKLVLIANLKFFNVMLLQSFKESVKNEVDLIGIDSELVEVFINYAYTGELKITQRNAFELLKVANYLNEKCIEDACTMYLDHYLQKDVACEAYNFASTAYNSKLKFISKRVILQHFDTCSRRVEYYCFEFEMVKDILLDARFDHPVSQRMYFEGILKWIAYNVSYRRIHIANLLNLIDLTALSTEYVLGFFCDCMTNHTYSSIMKDVMLVYRQKCKPKKTPDTMMIVHRDNHNPIINIRFYDFKMRLFSSMHKLLVGHEGISSNGLTIVKNTLYYYSGNCLCTSPGSLYRYDTKTELANPLSFNFNYVGNPVMCASTVDVYICGVCAQNESLYNQIVKYDTKEMTLKILPAMNDVYVNYAACTYYQGWLYVFGMRTGNSSITIEKYNDTTGTWVRITPMKQRGDSKELSITSLSGRLFVCFENIVEAYDPLEDSWEFLPQVCVNDPYRICVVDGKLSAVRNRFDGNMVVRIFDFFTNTWNREDTLSIHFEFDGFDTTNVLAVSNGANDYRN